MKSFNMIFIILVFTGFVLAEHQGTIKGRIIDQVTKQPVAGANILLLETNLGATSNEAGIYIIENVPENIYKLEIQFISYDTYIESDVRVVRSKTTYVKEIELNPSVLEGEVIEVISDGFNENNQSPVSNFNYSREEIKRSPGAGGDIFRAIETLPGVSSNGGEFSAFSVRGGSPKENIILIDEIPFDKVSHFVGGSQDEEIQGGRFSIFIPGLIEQADFQAGGFSAQYGGKNASVIKLKIKEANNDDFTVDGRYDLVGWEATYNGPTYLFNNTSVLLSARQQDYENLFKLLDNEKEGHPRFADYIFKSTTHINSKHKISLLGIYSTENMDQNLKHLFKDELLEDVNLVDLEEQKHLIGLNWRYLTNTKSYLNTSVYYENSNTNMKSSRAYPDIINGIAPTIENTKVRRDINIADVESDMLGIKSNFTYQFTKQMNLTTGIEIDHFADVLDYTQNGFDTVYVFGANDYRPDPSQKYIIRDPAFITRKYDAQNTSYQAFTELSLTFLNRLTLTPGLRYEYNEFDTNHYLAPRISSRFNLKPGTSINFATGIYYQRPDFRTIAADTRNNSLKNEKAVHYILGVSHILNNRLRLTIEGYYKSFDDLVVRANRNTNYAQNTGDGWASGFDISLIHRFVDKFYGQINYSYSISKRNDHDGFGAYNSDFNQPHIFNILAGYQLNKNWSFAAKWKYATGRPTDSYIVHNDIFNNPNFVRYSQEITGNNDDRFEDFHTLNIRIDYRQQLWSRLAAIAYLDLLNAYGHKNYNSATFSERNGKVIYDGFEFLPSAGIKLEF